MTRVHSGLIMIGAGILMNVVGRLLMAATSGSPNPALAGFFLVWMAASVVLGLFGLFRLITGLVRRGQ